MVDSVVDLDIFDSEWIDPFQAANIVAILLRIRATLVMCVDAADRAEKVARLICIEPIFSQMLVSLYNPEPGERN